MSIRNQVYFAQVPEWVLYSEVSDRAVRLYATLNRHANKQRKAEVYRSALARELRCSRDSVDRAMGELRAIRAVVVTRQNAKPGTKEFGKNEYLVMFIPPRGRTGAATSDGDQAADQQEQAVADDPGRTGAATSPQGSGDRGRTPAATGGRTGAAEDLESPPNPEPTEPEKISSAASRRERPLDPLIEILCVEAEGATEGSRAMPASRVRTVAVAASKIRPLGATPEDAHLAIVNWPTHFPGATLTAPAIAEHWARLQRPGPNGVDGVRPRSGRAKAADEDWSDIPDEAWDEAREWAGR